MVYLPTSAQRYDVIVVGSGYAGFAAALACQRAGRRTLLVDRYGALLPESGWSFSRETGGACDPLWREWESRLARHAGGAGEGAIAEVVASAVVVESGLSVLYYAALVDAAQTEDGALAWVTVATKAGRRRLEGGQWIDATDTGDLLRLVCPTWVPAPPLWQSLHLYYRHPHEAPLPAVEVPAPAVPGAPLRLTWRPSAWRNEQVLNVYIDGAFERPRSLWLPALRALHAAVGADLEGAVLTHGSIVPFSAYPSTDPRDQVRNLPRNVLSAGANGGTLAAKFHAGTRAADALASQPASPVSRLVPEQPTYAGTGPDLTADVGVAGLGTGGAVAAIAAARAGARVAAFEAMPFPGGVGTGAGIHFYYFGVKGGLQEEIDARVRELMPVFGTPAQVGGFHPEAKKQVLDDLLHAAGVQTRYGALLCGTRASCSRVDRVEAATTGGVVAFHADVWIDATGDGDLAAAAGAQYRLGRTGDGLLHAYGQSSGRAQVVNGLAKLRIMNFDAGFCDPTDEQDLTRARLAGVHTYLQDHYDAEERPTYIAPAIGLRQSRHIDTDYTLSLDDLINRQRFPDAIGYTGCHYDNHARDYEFESDEAAFWVWVCQQWYGRLACEIPYRLLLPRGLDNVLIACRAAGVSEEAHHSFRMQRDMQRLGEAAGVAGALAARDRTSCRAVPYAELEAALSRSGALRREAPADTAFGHHAGSEHFEIRTGRLAAWLAELRGGPATEALWHLYRSGPEAKAAVVPLLRDGDRTVSWRAAALLAMWGDPLAEPRLREAIRTREEDRGRDITKPQQAWFYMPRWYAALTLLKRCLTVGSLPLLEELAQAPELPLNARCAVALACEALATRHVLTGEQPMRVQQVLESLLATEPPQGIRGPQDSPLPAPDTRASGKPTDLQPVTVDYRWQLHLAVLRARLALGLQPHRDAYQFAEDDRAIVRRSFMSRLKDPRSLPRPPSAPSP